MGRRGRFLDRIGAEDWGHGTDLNRQKVPMQGKPETTVTHVPQGRITIIVSIEL
jgi:hypothetical protein